MKPNRCKKCNRMIRDWNKNGYCSSCSSNEARKEKMRHICFICEEKCSGNRLIEWHKDKIISLCPCHFNWLLKPEYSDPKLLRKEVKRLKYGVTL